MLLYAEWISDGEFRQGEFDSYADYYNATFGADVLRVHLIEQEKPKKKQKNR